MPDFEEARDEFLKAFGSDDVTPESFDFGKPDEVENPSEPSPGPDEKPEEVESPTEPEAKEPEAWQVEIEKIRAENAALRARFEQQRQAPAPVPQPQPAAPAQRQLNPLEHLYQQDDQGNTYLNPQALQAALGGLAANQKHFADVAAQTAQMRLTLEAANAGAHYDAAKAKYPDLEKYVTRQHLDEVIANAAKTNQFGQPWETHIRNAYYIAAGDDLRKQADEVGKKREAARAKTTRTAAAISPGGATFQAPAQPAPKRGGSMKDAQKAFRQEYFNAG